MKLRFFMPDSQDLVDPSFDFRRETRSRERVRQRDDVYAHELFSSVPYDGILVSKAIVDGIGGSGAGRYTLGQRTRFMRCGVRAFLRAEDLPIPIMGDCGAFSYIGERTPPYSVEDVASFYEVAGFDAGVSLDHVILPYRPEWDDSRVDDEGKDARERQELTLQYASEFRKLHKRQKLSFMPLGVAQGWSPRSYRRSLSALQKMGYRYIAVGGLVPYRDHQILATLEAMNEVRRGDTRLHLLGVTRTHHVEAFTNFGAASFDSTSPLRQAFKDDKDNYYLPGGNALPAVRVPQLDGNPKLQRRIRSGEVDQSLARTLEGSALELLRKYAARRVKLDELVPVLCDYERLLDPTRQNEDVYREVLGARPWEKCPCDVCRTIGYQVILFRGAERNKRRGFHNTWVFRQRLNEALDQLEPPKIRGARKGRAQLDATP
ncbi:MAG: tRNA-guanine transglycosylase DpdA [Polyangiaceae bacterium]